MTLLTDLEKLRYLPIGNYGVIGNLETVALVGLNGAIDFMCYPKFDSPSIFARLLDRDKGGFFQIRPDGDDFTTSQIYLPETNVLVTRFLSEKGIVEVTDFMPICESCTGNQLIRMVKCLGGEVKMRMVCQPAFDYGRTEMSIRAGEESGMVEFSSDQPEGTRAQLRADVELAIDASTVRAAFALPEGDTVSFHYLCESCEKDEEADTAEALQMTVEFWRKWLSQCKYRGRWREQVERSALALKLLFSRQHGSIVAAPTFSFPEAIGGERNWDYRYCWVRDSAFTVYAMLRLGFRAEVDRYVDWISGRYDDCAQDGSLNLMYRLDGSNDIEEEQLEHWEGYRESAPVRIGNGAAGQLQMDIYGELIDSLYLAHKYSSPITHEGWENITKTVNFVCENWEREDEGIWEVRGGRKHFLHSRLMCWVAIDRAVRLSRKGSYPAEVEKWCAVRDKIYADIHENFWNEERGAFVQHRGSETMDASVLLMPLVKFISPVDPRWISTIEAVEQDLVSDAFVMRYADASGFEGVGDSEEGSFTICSFWYCENLARMGRIEDARRHFGKLLAQANHLGLYAEELGNHGEQLGNFPQAFTHLALISAALAIDSAIEDETQQW